MRPRTITAALATLLLVATPASWAEPPPNPIPSFEAAKTIARDTIYVGHHTDFYCGCKWEPKGKSGGVIDAAACGYEPKKDRARGKRLEWEHVMPAWFFAHNLRCWKEGDDRCENNDGKKLTNRDCCRKVNARFRKIEADLHNLVPAVGELNGNRSNTPYGFVDGEPRQYGRCNFEIGGDPKVTEPPDNVRGDAARVWFYMSETYGISIPPAMAEMFRQWSEADPPDEWELRRNERIFEAQGNRNPFVRRPD